jgi:acetolactate synthase-1/2/3 large subunit
MGYSLPATIGTCYDANKTPPICVESDGSLMLNLQKLVTLKAQNLPIILIVINNGGYASIRNTEKNYFNGRYLGNSPNSELLIPNIVELSKAIGIPGNRITDIKELFVELQSAIKHQGPFVCEVILESEEVLTPKVTAIRQADGSIISMPLEDMTPLPPIEQLTAELMVPLLDTSLKARNFK